MTVLSKKLNNRINGFKEVSALRLLLSAGGFFVLLSLFILFVLPILGFEPEPLQRFRKALGLAAGETRNYDVVVVGGTSVGVGAAISAARQGVRVALVEETPRLGGMITNGVSGTDIVNPQASSGLFEEFRKKVAEYYQARGRLSQVRDGLNYEPDVAAQILETMVSQTSGIDVLRGYYLKETGGVVKSGNRVVQIIIQNNAGSTIELNAKIFIDSTDAGDLLALAGTEGTDWVVGRESKGSYGEEHAGEVYVDSATQNRIGGSGSSSSKIQAYNFRMILQKNGFTGYSVPPDYATNLPTYRALTQSPRWGGFSCREYPAGIWIQTCLPNDKLDINIDLVGANHGYPKGSRTTRQQIYQKLKNFAIGYLHFLRTEKRAELGYPDLGLSADDFDDNGHFPTRLYVREGRRMIGTYVFKEQDAVVHSGSTSSRPPGKTDSIAIGDYPADSHCVGEYVAGLGCEGGFYLSANSNWKTKPYQIPLGVIVPKRIDGLLVPLAVSATHVGYGALRMEPIRMNLGQAAGTVAVLAMRGGIQPRQISLRKLQINLVSQGQALMYFSDLPPTHWGFQYIQALAGRGVISGYPDYTVKPDQQITRAEVAKIAVLGLQIPINTTGGPHFSDVKTSDWFYPYVETLYNANIIGGYPDGTFRPGNLMSRAEVAKVAVLGKNLTINTTGGPHFIDVPLTHWAYPYVETLYNNGIVQGYPDGTFKPDGYVIRAEAAKIFELTSRVGL